MDGNQGHDPVELGFEASFVGFERDIVERVAPLGLLASHADEVAQAGSKNTVALVDDLLGVAQEMGEADLLLFPGPAGLGGVAIGDPGVRADVAEELLDRPPKAG